MVLLYCKTPRQHAFSPKVVFIKKLERGNNSAMKASLPTVNRDSSGRTGRTWPSYSLARGTKCTASSGEPQPTTRGGSLTCKTTLRWVGGGGGSIKWRRIILMIVIITTTCHSENKYNNDCVNKNNNNADKETVFERPVSCYQHHPH